ncbi:MAG: DUF975 family protein [Blautia sp.]|nr:DUF975 family protein [Blautia sp.]MCM1200329.1 DUF975 family protein [Bacteroides fragilis]
MWSRETLKNDAKITLRNYFGTSILAGLVLTAASGIGNITVKFTDLDFHQFTVAQLWGITVSSSLASIFSILIQIFLANLLTVGASYFFLSSRIRLSGVESIGFGFKKGRYGNVCKTMFLMNLFISLWSLLFVIPGIYKSYQYRLVPYLLAENPEMDYQRALSLSASMMEGEKWNAFILDLSFIGWYLLSVFTCMILAVVYVEPYQHHTNAGLYIALRERAIENGLVNPAELYAVVNNVQ